MLKKILSILMVLGVTVALFGAVPVSTEKEYTSGYYTYTVTAGEVTILYVSTSITGDVIIPSTFDGYPVTGIDDDAFCDCFLITSVVIPDGVTSIGKWAFSGCSKLVNIVIPDSVTSIGNNAFAYCRSLVNIAIPKSVTTIEEEMFSGCFSLANITIPDSVVNVENYAFDLCESFKTVYYTGTTDDFLKISIGDGNDKLINADIIHLNGIEAYLDDVSCSYIDNKVSATVKFGYITKSGMLHLAIYERGRLVALNNAFVSLGENEKTIEIEDVDESYIGCDVKVLYWEDGKFLTPLAKVFETKVTEYVPVLESTHPYANNANETRVYTYAGNCSSINVIFSSDTRTEINRDRIQIYDVNDRKIGEYSDTQLAGKTINVPGNTVKIKLKSDGQVTYYGYRAECIVAKE